MTAVCEHVGLDRRTAEWVITYKERDDQVLVRCPCCGATAWRDPDDDLVGDDCPYCEVGTVPA